MSNEHLTLEELHLFVDVRSSPSEQERLRAHVQGCEHCRRSVEDVQRFEARVRSTPLEKVSPEFTHVLLARLPRAHGDSRVYRILSGLAPIIGVLFVLGVLAGTFILAGSQESLADPDTGSVVRTTISQATTAASEFLREGTSVIQRLFPFLSESKSGTLSLLVVMAFIVLAVLDRLLFRRLVQRV